MVVAFPRMRRQSGLTVVSVASAVLIYRSAAVILLAISVAVYVYVLIVTDSRNGGAAQSARRWRIAVLSIWGLIVLYATVQWIVAHRKVGADSLTPLVGIAMGMWWLLRHVTLMWELGSGRIQRPSSAGYLTWVTLPFTVGGPLLRYSEFERQWVRFESVPRGRVQLPARFGRGLGEAIAKGLVGAALTVASAGLTPHSFAQQVWLVLGLNLWSWYLLASSFYHLMELFALPWGLELPPSFNRPFGRPNLSEFWARWNMSATAVFRDYMFYNRWGRRTVTLYFNVFALFIAVGAWHGLNSYWLTWGFMHACGFAAYLWWKRHKDRFTTVRNLLSIERRTQLSVLATYFYVVACWVLPPKLLQIAGLLQ